MSLWKLVLYFLQLGFMSFGGPIALVGQIERDLVEKRKWVTQEEMHAAIALGSLPGPLTIQIGIFIAYLRGGCWGAWMCGWAFIVPNLLIVATLGAFFIYFTDLQLTGIIFGIAPAVVALVLYTSYRLARLGMEDGSQWLIAIMCFTVTVAFETEIALLFIVAGAIGILLYGNLFRRREGMPLLALSPAAASSLTWTTLPTSTSASGSLKLLLFFLKTGAFTFGSGLVIIPILKQDLITKYGWLGEREYLIAVIIGMISPEPVLMTAIYVGYLFAGLWGSFFATMGIFLPSFLIALCAAAIMACNSFNVNFQGFIKGAYAAAFGTILGACILLEKIAIGDWFTTLIAIVSLAVLFRWRVNNLLLLGIAAIVGLIAFPILQPAWLPVR